MTSVQEALDGVLQEGVGMILPLMAQTAVMGLLILLLASLVQEASRRIL